MARTGKSLEKKESSLMFIEISPPHKWDQDLHSHYLRLTLPGFTNKDISLHVDKYGHLVVRGSHQMTEHKYVSFAETFDVPEGADLEQAEGMFEDDQIYCVAIPKNNTLGQHIGDGGSNSKRVKSEDHDHDHDHDKDKKVDSIFPMHGVGGHVSLPYQSFPYSNINKEKSMKKIVFLIAILVAMYVAWLNRDLEN